MLKNEKRYRFKKYLETYKNKGEPEFAKWGKLDMCEDCFRKLKYYVRDKGVSNNDCSNT